MPLKIYYCKHCLQPLNQLYWNAQTDMLLCDNEHCGLFHRPQGSPEVKIDDERRLVRILDEVLEL